MQIRPFQANDAATCAQILAENKDNIGDLYDAAGLKKAAQYNKYWVAVETQAKQNKPEKIFGIIGLSDLQNGIAMIGTTCVARQAQGKGVGRQLLQHLKQEAKKQNFRKILLLTHEKNKAMMILAIKEDFIPEGSLRKHFRDGQRDVIYFSYFV